MPFVTVKTSILGAKEERIHNRYYLLLVIFDGSKLCKYLF